MRTERVVRAKARSAILAPGSARGTRRRPKIRGREGGRYRRPRSETEMPVSRSSVSSSSANVFLSRRRLDSRPCPTKPRHWACAQKVARAKARSAILAPGSARGTRRRPQNPRPRRRPATGARDRKPTCPYRAAVSPVPRQMSSCGGAPPAARCNESRREREKD